MVKIMVRISKAQMFMEMAITLSRRGNCQRGQVGALLTKDNRVIATGYNGPLRGSVDCSSINCDLLQSCTRAIHAEANALYFAAKHGIPTDNTTLYCTHSPCLNCAKAIIQAGVKKVIYLKQYNPEGCNLLNSNGVKILPWDGQ